MKPWRALTLALVLVGCGDPAEPVAEWIPGGAPVCAGGPRVPAILVNPRIATPGANPNVIRDIGGGEFAIVESFDNRVSVLDRDGNLSARADVGNDRNPYDIAVSGDELWVTNYVAQSVSVVARDSGEVLAELEASSLDDPAGVGRFGDTVYVTNVAFTAPTQPYGDGSVTAFDAQTRRPLGQLDVPAKNPLFLQPMDVEGEPAMVLVSSGELELSDSGAGVSSPGAVEIWRSSGDPLRPQRTTFALPQVDDRQIGAPGRPLQTPDGRLYFASATAPILFSLDPASGWLHGTDDPLRFSDTSGDSLHHADVDDQGVLYITSFNRDSLYLWDTTCDQLLAGPIDLGESEFLEGPHGIVVAGDSGQPDRAYFITNALTGSEAVGEVVFDWSG